MAIAQTRELGQIKFVAIHHSAVAGVPPNRAALERRLASHEKHHCQKNYPVTRGEFGYPCLLYHFAIAGNGEWVQTQDISYMRWHSTDNYKGSESSNLHGIAILLEGNFQEDVPTSLQLESAAKIIRNLEKQLGRNLAIRGHKENAAPRYSTSCPGLNMGMSSDPNGRLSWIIRRVAEFRGDQFSPPAVRTAVVLASAGLRLRREPNTDNANIITAMPQGAVVEVLGVSGRWANVVYRTQRGWAHTDYLRIQQAEVVPPAAVSERKDELLLVIRYLEKRLEETKNPSRELEIRWLLARVSERLDSVE